MQTVEVLYDHYKETCALIAAAISRRERLMLWMLVVLALFAIHALFPGPAEQIARQYLSQAYSVDQVPIDFGVFSNCIWIALLLFTLRYYQTCAYIERQYPYLHSLEDKINQAVTAEIITREGKSYEEHYPLFQWWLTILYRYVFNALLVLIATVRIFSEVRTKWPDVWSATLLADLVVYISLVVSVALYLLMLRGRKRPTSASSVSPHAALQ